jgi:hypothetical protein
MLFTRVARLFVMIDINRLQLEWDTDFVSGDARIL